MSHGRILIVEDNEIEREMLVDFLTNEGFSVISSGTAERVFESALFQELDLAIIDWLLPQMSGLELARQLRARAFNGAIVLLSSKTDLDSQITGLTQAADDYWTKPVSLKLLKAKIIAAIRKNKTSRIESHKVSLGNIICDLRLAKLKSPFGEYQLGHKEVGILKVLILSEGGTVAKNALMAAVWKYTYLPKSRTVDNYIMDLRHKLEEISKGKVTIITKRSIGYQLRVD